jgi:Cu-Zn family superoxide dismutase
MSCKNAVAMFNGTIKGVVEFHQCTNDSGVWVNINLSNFKPNKTHAIHIHEFGDEREGCTSLGSHWNPMNTTHGSLEYNMPSHAGDMINNLRSDKHGKFNYSYYDPRITIKGTIDETIIGRSIVIHYGQDDLGLGGIDPFVSKVRSESLKTGNAGKRLACAIIGIAKDGSF